MNRKNFLSQTANKATFTLLFWDIYQEYYNDHFPGDPVGVVRLIRARRNFPIPSSQDPANSHCAGVGPCMVFMRVCVILAFFLVG